MLSNFGISDPNGIVENNSTVLAGAGFDEDASDTFASFDFDQSAVSVPLSVIGTSPSSDSTTQSVSSVTVTFDREIDPFSILSGDFFLDRSADADGAARSIGVEMAYLDEADASNRRISFTLNTSLPIGQYQIRLSGQGELAGLDGTRAAEGEDRILGSFRIAADQLDLKKALDLGTVSATTIVHSGRLDLQSNPTASDLYKFSVPAGRDWNLSLDVSSQRDGLSLDAVATLYDEQGTVIATVDRGKSDAPLDPSLTRRIAGGVYYIAVAGRLTDDSTDGSYKLHLVASPSQATTSVTGIRELRANPNTLELTGFSIDFSGPIDPNSLLIESTGILSLVDGQGQSWPVALTGLSVNQTRLTFVLGAALPVGSYQIRLGDASTLADLSGRAPSGPGIAAGILGTIDVVALAKSSPTELGTLWANVGSKLGGVVTLADGITQTRSFTLLAQGSVALTVVGDSSLARFSILDAEGRPISSVQASDLDRSKSGSTLWNYVLGAGTYTLSIESNGPVTTSFDFSLVVKTTSAASLLDSGVGQGPTTDPKVIVPAPLMQEPVIPTTPGRDNLSSTQPLDQGNQIVSPIAEPFLGDSTDQGPLSSNTGSEILVSSPAAGPHQAGVQFPGSLTAPGETYGATILIGGTPVGRPATTFDLINVVGPAPSTGSFALASSLPTLPNGLLQVVAEGLIADSNEVGEPAGTIWGRPSSKGMKAPSIAPRPGTEGEATDSMSDHSILDMTINLGWFNRMTSWVEDFLDPESSSALEPDVASGAIEIAAGAPWVETANRIDSASLASPALLIGGVLAVYRTRVEMRKRARQSAGRDRQDSLSARNDFQPNCRSGNSR